MNVVATLNDRLISLAFLHGVRDLHLRKNYLAVGSSQVQGGMRLASGLFIRCWTGDSPVE